MAMNPSARRFGLIFGLSISTAVAMVGIAAVSTASQAQLRTGPNFSGAFRGASMHSVNPTFRTEPRFHQFDRLGSNKTLKLNNSKVKSTVKGRGKGTDTASNGDGDGKRPGHRPPRHRPDGPIVNPVIGTGVAVGTGIAVGTGLATGPAGAGPAGTGPAGAGGGGGTAAQIFIPPDNENRFVKDEVLLHFARIVPQPVIAQALARNGLLQLELQNLTLSGTTFVRARIVNGRDVRTVLRGLRNETTLLNGALLNGQANLLFRGSQQQGTSPTFTPQPPATPAPTPAVATAAALPKGGDPAQYALEKIHLNEAHSFANGEKLVVAVIDSGVDLSHPELAGAVAGSFDALGKREAPHMHGTAIAGAIVAHARLMGAAPAAKILAIRAFSAAEGDAEATTYAIVKGVEYAMQHNARVINMSFAGPSDPALARELAAAKAKGAVLIAASGNYGPKSPPQFPAADPNVIAVSATDADDKLFLASNIGPHISVSAPGVDILLPVPNRNYEMISGTSFSAAYVSGVAALILQRAPGLTPDAVRHILESTAKDIGPAGKDPEFGAGLVDALSAIMAVQANASAAAITDTAQPGAKAQ
jgi:Subtilase family